MTEAPLLDPRGIVEALGRHEVRYVLIGGLAAALHGSPLRTNDADICPAQDPENLDRLAAALSDMGARIALPDDEEGVAFPHVGEFLGRVQVWNLVTRFGRLDISLTPSGTSGYEDLYRAVTRMDLGDGLVAPVAALLDVIRSKQAAGRDKDYRALPVLRQLLAEVHRPPREPD